jgi:RNA polymerase sigma-70 factor (ECF subfamily)
MFHVAKKMVGDSDDVSDIVQEVFICLLDKLNNGHAIHNPKNWLYRATYNKCVDYFREQKRFQSIESRRDSLKEDESLDKQEAKSIINFALSKLRPKERIIAVLYSEGLTYKEIADASGIKYSSIGKTLSRTLEKLERELKNQKYELY